MKKLVYQYFNGSSSYANKSAISVRSYAESIDAEYKLYTDEVPKSVYYGTFSPFFNGDYEKYDMICYIDSDVLATKAADNIFRYANNNIGIHHMISCEHVRPEKQKEVSMFVQEMGVPEWKAIGHANAGVVLFPAARYDSFLQYLTKLDQLHIIASTRNGPQGHLPFGGYDQSILNMYNRDNGTNNLPWRFNYHLNQYKPEFRTQASLIHYHSSYKNLLHSDFDSEAIRQ